MTTLMRVWLAAPYAEADERALMLGLLESDTAALAAETELLGPELDFDGEIVQDRDLDRYIRFNDFHAAPTPAPELNALARVWLIHTDANQPYALDMGEALQAGLLEDIFKLMQERCDRQLVHDFIMENQEHLPRRSV